MNTTTIAAVSTPRGKGGVALIRISGTLSRTIADKIFSPADNRPFSEHAPRTEIYGSVIDPNSGSVIDDALAAFFVAPHSFTGEDVVEIACHGGEIVSGMVLEAALLAGAMMAERGEFSRRAFMNGKMSLTAAEGVADLLDARTPEAARLSSKAARGKLSERIDAVSERLLAISASLWAYLDYPEEDLQTFSDDELSEKLNEVIASLSALSDSFRMGKAVNTGVRAVIVGKPNAGKSTFFNAMLGENKAIVTEIPGTTRDLIEYPLSAGRVLLNLCDTAGVRENTGDIIEKMGIERSLNSLNDAEIIFALFDSSRVLDGDDALVFDALARLGEGKVVIPVLTKTDLPQKTGADSHPILQNALTFSRDRFQYDELIARLEKEYIFDEKAYGEGAVLTNIRQKTAIEKTCGYLREALSHLHSGQKDLSSLEMESALASLLETDGKSAGEKILDEVFSRFCVGK